MQNIFMYEATNQTASIFLCQGKQHIYPLTCLEKIQNVLSAETYKK